MIMAIVAGKLLPEMTREHRPVGVLIGFTLGVALMLGVKALIDCIERSNEQTGGRKAALPIAVGVDVFLDGLLIGVGYVLASNRAFQAASEVAFCTRCWAGPDNGRVRPDKTIKWRAVK